MRELVFRVQEKASRGMSEKALTENKDVKSQDQLAARHLFLKGLAGLLLGFPLSLWISWLIMYSGWGPAFAPARDQVSMWLVAPLWATVLSLVFLANTLARCLLWLIAANMVAAGLWWALQ